MRVVDLSGPLEPGIWRYDASFPEFTSEPVTSIEGHGYVVRRVTIGTHMGTHTDALGHLVSGGPMIDSMPLESYVGWASVLRVGASEPLRPIDADVLGATGVEPLPGDVILIETGWSRQWNLPDFPTTHPYLTMDAARWLVDRQPRCVGMDTPGLMDPRIELSPGANRPIEIVDQTFLEAGVCYVAGLVNLDSIVDPRPLFVAVPLKLAGLDGAPVRAVAVEGLGMRIES